MSPPSARRQRSPLSWDPLRDLLSLKDRLNRLFENLLRRGDFEGAEITGWVPAADLREHDEAFVLTVELPGVRGEELRIRVDRGLVTLEGAKAPDAEAREADHLRVERTHGPFARTFTLPTPVDESRVTARLRLGVLEVLLPKSRQARSRPVSVKVS
ncbi:MAG: Hsp20/alpha crystallin family protein [Acidobacteriota bacterium]